MVSPRTLESEMLGMCAFILPHALLMPSKAQQPEILAVTMSPKCRHTGCSCHFFQSDVNPEYESVGRIEL